MRLTLAPLLEKLDQVRQKVIASLQGSLWLQLWLSSVAVVLTVGVLIASAVHFLILPALLHIPDHGPRGGLPLWPYLKDLLEVFVLSVLVGLAMYPIIRARTNRLEHLMAQVGAMKLGDFRPDSQAQDKQDELSVLEAQLQDAKRHLEQLFGRHKDYLALASHELRTPITRLHLGIEGIERKLLAQQGGADELSANLVQMKRDVQEVHTLIEEILLASKLDNPKLHPVFTQIDVLALAAEEASHFNIPCTGQIVFVQGDDVLLRRVLRNLMENALKFAPAQTVRVWVGVCPDTDNGVRIEVLDQGEGVPVSMQTHIFEPYARLSSGAGGAGLGLALVREIARLHGGEVSYHTNLPRGSILRVDLPRQQSFTQETN